MVVLILLIHCLLLLPLFEGSGWGSVFGPFCYAVLSVPYSFEINLMGGESWLLYFYCVPGVCDL